ncbi:hypothetical protein MG290_08310 [Flavobacterium sp. CBA20B-1]|uniref:hypothetical protein n=1 Tax=unclassified Flavobacterium TaxID=196869 RepID=UPI002225089D|nr:MULTISPECIES: hypothetical protein [unclassified Flavobacterium]WCM40965.1 hypothetical protein MG290_08310 [Flavobacterium sp. CBA20B-1]
MKNILTLFIICLLTGCSSHIIKNEVNSGYILSVTDFMEKNAIDETNAVWYLEKDSSGSLILNNEKFKVYYFHFFYNADQVYSCCLDNNYSNDKNILGDLHKNEEVIIGLEDNLPKKAYSLFDKKRSKIIIYKIKEIEGCKCGKEKVFPNDNIDDFYVPTKLNVQALKKQEKKLFRENIDHISKYFDTILDR